MLAMKFIVSLLLVFKLSGTALASDWTYSGTKGPSKWASLKSTFGACDDTAQSPIDIPKESSSVEFDETLTPFKVSGTNVAVLNLINNGHTVQLNILGNVIVTGGKLTKQHKVAQLHFHWGQNSNEGSEHTRGGMGYPLEMHVVSYNTKYPNISTAAPQTDGLAVLGFWFKISSSDNSQIASLLGHLADVKYADQTAAASDVDLSTLVPSALDRYFRYKGSLTTPPCYESVTWTVFDEPIMISEKQVDLFRSLYEQSSDEPTKHLIGHNFRPVQQLNGRQITRSFMSGSSEIRASLALLGLVYLISLL